MSDPSMSDPRRDRMLALGAPAFLVGLWEVAIRTGVLDARFFPPPSLVVLTFWRLLADGTLAAHTAAKIGRAHV